MKKLFIAAFAVFAFASVDAQNFSAGIHGGVPTGDVSDFFSFTAGLDVNAMWDVSDSFELGVVTGFTSAFGEDSTIDDYQYIPLAAGARYNVSEKFQLGADLGYALGVGDESDGGLYYRPMIGYNLSDSLQLTASYRVVDVQDASVELTAFGLGLNYSF